MRLRGKASDGALGPGEYGLHDGSEAKLLDLLEVELHYALPSNAHPEDWVIAPTRWRLVERPLRLERWNLLDGSVDTASTVFRGYRDRMSTDEVRDKPLQASLALVCPSDLWWWVKEEQGKRKCRALFHRNNVTYDFAVTDPHWLDLLNLMPAGIYPTRTFVDDRSEVWLTVSLSEAFYGWHYKLVAAVIVRPAAAKRAS